MIEAESKSSVVPVEAHHYEMFDLADEDQIIAEIQGRVTDKYVYELKGVKNERGEPVNGLSYAGTNWAVREYAKRGEVIRIIGKPTYEVCPIDPEYVLVSVAAQRFAVPPEGGKETPLDTRPGVKRQWRKMKKNKYENGEKVGEEIVEDPFFWEKGLSKATRNAMQALIPTDIVKQLISEALKKKHSSAVDGSSSGRQAKPARGAAPAKPAPQQAASSNQPAAAAPPAAASAAPQQAGAKQGQPPAGGAAAPQSKDALIQKFEIVLKAAFNTQDGKVARQGLKKIHGTENISDLSEEDLKKYGKILQVVPKTFRISDDGTHVFRVDTGEVVWGKRSEPLPAQEPAQTDESMF